jgi:hypothetical protein
VLEAEERVFSNRHDASVPHCNTVGADDYVAQDNTVRADASVPQCYTVRSTEVDEDETPAKRPYHHVTSSAKATPLEVMRWTRTRTRRQPDVSAMKLLSQR